MKVLLVDPKNSGHHSIYMKNIVDMQGCDFVYLHPDKLSDNGIYLHLSCGDVIDSVIEAAQVYKADIIHFLYGDTLLADFGRSVAKVKRATHCRIVITLHQFRYSLLRDIARVCLCRSCDAVIVHTESQKKWLGKRGVNVKLLHYPRLNQKSDLTKEQAREVFGLPCDKKILLALGALRYDKGIDILLDALFKVREDFHLLIAGAESDFDRNFVSEKSSAYSDRVTLCLEKLDDAKYAAAIAACDVAVLPYRTSFDGASGPLVDAIDHEKTVIAPNKGSLGSLVKTFDLGAVFESEDSDSLAEVVQKVLLNDFQINDKYKEFVHLTDKTVYRKDLMEIYSQIIIS